MSTSNNDNSASEPDAGEEKQPRSSVVSATPGEPSQRPVSAKTGKPLSASQIAFRERMRRQRRGGPTRFFNTRTGKYEDL